MQLVALKCTSGRDEGSVMVPYTGVSAATSRPRPSSGLTRGGGVGRGGCGVEMADEEFGGLLEVDEGASEVAVRGGQPAEGPAVHPDRLAGDGCGVDPRPRRCAAPAGGDLADEFETLAVLVQQTGPGRVRYGCPRAVEDGDG